MFRPEIRVLGASKPHFQKKRGSFLRSGLIARNNYMMMGGDGPLVMNLGGVWKNRGAKLAKTPCGMNTADPILYQIPYCIRADSKLAPSQWGTSLQSNAVPHWLGATKNQLCVCSVSCTVIHVFIMLHTALMNGLVALSHWCCPSFIHLCTPYYLCIFHVFTHSYIAYIHIHRIRSCKARALALVLR